MKKPSYEELESRVKDFENKIRKLEFHHILSVYSQSPIPTLIIDDDCRIVDFNDAMAEFVEYSREELASISDIDSLIKILVPDEKEGRRFLKSTRKALKNKLEIKRDEYYIVRKNGKKRYIELSLFDILDGNDTTGFKVLQGIDITDSKQAEEGLRLLSSAVEQSTEGITLCDLDGNLLFVNNAFSSMHGFTPEELIGKHSSVFHSPEQIPAIEKALERMRMKGEFNGEIWHVQRDGTVFPTVTHMTLVRDTSGNPIGYIKTLKDITERKRLENQRQALRRIRDEVLSMRGVDDIKHLMKVLKDTLQTTDLSYQDVNINVIDKKNGNKVIHSFVLTREEEFSDTSTEDTSDILFNFWESGVPAYRKDLDEEDPYNERDLLREVWGNVRSVLDIPFSHGTLGLNSGEPNAFSNEDIRFLREIAQALSEGFQRSEDLQKLAQSETRYRSLVETPADQVVILLDKNGDFLYISPQIVQHVGCDMADFYGDPEFHRSIIHLEDCTAVEEAYNKVIDGSSRERIEFRFQNGEGEWNWALMTMFPILAHDGSVKLIQAMIQDITDQKRAEEALRSSEAKNKAILDALPDIMFQIKADGTFIGYKGNPEELYAKPENFIGKTVQDVMPPPIADLTWKHICRTLETGRIQIYEYDLEIIGELRHYESRMIRSKEDEVLVIIRDETMRKRLEAQHTALQRLRQEVLNMTGFDDIERVLKVLRENLIYTHIPFSNGCINIIEKFETPAIRTYNLTGKKHWSYLMPDHAKDVIMRIWESGIHAYRRDMQNEDIYSERSIIEKSWGNVRSVIDIPFSHGTLALNSDKPDAFNPEDIAFLRDISQILSEGFQRAEDLQQLALSEARYRTLVEAPADQAVKLIDIKGQYLYISPQIETLTGYSAEEYLANRRIEHDIEYESDRKKREDAFAKALRGKPVINVESLWRNKNGELNWVSESFVPIYDGKDTIEAVQIVAHNISDLKKAEKALRESEEKYQNLYDYVPDIYFTISENGTILSANKYGAEYLGYEKQEMIGKPLSMVVFKDDQGKVQKQLKDIFAKNLLKKEIECRKIRRDGSIIWVHGRTNLILDTNGSPLELRIVCRDITEMKQAREVAKKSLEEKEILLKEIHHRVKNNMQVISSLLSLQSERIIEEPYINMFKESINRIQTMALIHELLYRSDNFSQIDFKEYITRICTYLGNIYMTQSGRVSVRVDVKDVFLKLDTAIPCGLVINELISNAFKYAFPDSRTGVIRLTMTEKKGGIIDLTVSDNGIGMPRDLDWKDTDTLGLKMVTLLIEGQLGGSIVMKRRKGTEFKIKFSK